MGRGTGTGASSSMVVVKCRVERGRRVYGEGGGGGKQVRRVDLKWAVSALSYEFDGALELNSHPSARRTLPA